MSLYININININILIFLPGHNPSHNRLLNGLIASTKYLNALNNFQYMATLSNG